MKKFLCLTAALLLVLGSAAGVMAADYSATVNMKTALAANMDTGEILFSKNPADQIAPCGAVKLMTALVVMDQQTDLTASFALDEASLAGIDNLDTETYLQEGNTVSVRDLLIEMLLSPAEDGALVLCNRFGGEEKFVAAMNQKAASLGMKNTVFVNACGAEVNGQHTTTEDLLLLAGAFYQNKQLMEIAGMPEYTFEPGEACSLDLTVKNENQLINSAAAGGIYESSANGLLAWDDGDSASLIATAVKDEKQIICILTGDESEDFIERWFTARDLLNFTFENTVVPTIPPETQPVPATVPATTEAPTEPSTEAATAPTADQGELVLQRQHHENQRIALMILFCMAVVMILVVVIRLVTRSQRKKNLHFMGYENVSDPAGAVLTVILIVVAVVISIVSGVCMWQYHRDSQPQEPVILETQPVYTTEATTVPTTEAVPETTAATLPPETVPAETEPPMVFAPHCTSNTDPANWGIEWKVIADDEFVENYQRPDQIHFGEPEEYFTGDGIITFRGNNYRNDATYGTADLKNGSMDYEWSFGVGDFNSWSGCGWTGQPLIVRWEPETRKVMNLYEEKKEKDDLVEVIYATLDGYIYFLDLDDGTRTRDPLWIGHNFKGAGALDPRGYPVLYVGSGDYIDQTSPRMFIISLIDGSILYSGGHNESYSLRGWNGFDSSPLVDAETDTLIWPGENGLLFTIKLNSQFNQAAGTFTINPDRPVMVQYTTERTSVYEYWVGFEDSVVMVDHYMYLSDNGGMFYCVDANTMELIWAQDTTDDSNSTPVFEWGEDGNGYIYTAPSLHYTTEHGPWGHVSIYKLDAQTGEIIWERPFEVGTVSGVSGGVQSTPLLGRPGSDIENLIIYSIARTPDMDNGRLVAFDKNNGSIVWELPMQNYAWSSPTAIYGEDGTSYVFIGDFTGDAFLLDGATGEILDTADLGSNIEASPAVFENKLVVGSRGASIFMLEIS